jgi:hypothetical protein
VSRQQKLFALVVVLVAANLWSKSSPHRPASEQRDSTGEGISVVDLTVNAAFTGSRSAKPMHRDVFQMRAREERPATQKTMTSPAEPRKSVAQMEEEAARADLAKIRLLGVVVREGKAQAYLALGTETYLAFEGDTVGNRFVVESVAVDSVELKDRMLNIRGRVPISGR